MNCAEFLFWLDTQDESPPAQAAFAHATLCARCAQQLAAAHRIDELLAAPLPPARAGLAAEVLQRVHESGAPDLLQATRAPVHAGFSWRHFLSDPGTLFAGVAVCMGLVVVLFARLPGAAARLRPGVAALRQLSTEGAQAVSGLISAPDAMPWMLFASAALAGAAWFSTRAHGLRTR